MVLLGVLSRSIRTYTKEAVSSNRIEAPESISDLVADAFERGQRTERARCADVIQTYPLDGFFYDEQNISTEEILRYRDTLSQAIAKSVPVGQMIK